jgi:hypothetical protein
MSEDVERSFCLRSLPEAGRINAQLDGPNAPGQSQIGGRGRVHGSERIVECCPLAILFVKQVKVSTHGGTG